MVDWIVDKLNQIENIWASMIWEGWVFPIKVGPLNLYNVELSSFRLVSNHMGYLSTLLLSYMKPCIIYNLKYSWVLCFLLIFLYILIPVTWIRNKSLKAWTCMQLEHNISIYKSPNQFRYDLIIEKM